MKRLQSLEALRAAAALLVVFYHIEAIFVVRTGFLPFLGLFGAGSRGVDLFFVLSGFIMTYVHRADWDRPSRLGNYLFNRFSRIYPGVWIMTVLAVGIYAAGFGEPDKAGKLSPWNVVASFGLFAQLGDPLVNVTWTLKYEMFFYLVFGVIILERRIGWAGFLLWQAAVLICALTGADRDDFWGGFYLRPICLEFSLGILVAIFVMGRRPVAWRFPAAALLLGSIGFVGGMLFDILRSPGTPDLPDYLYFGPCSALIILGLALLEAGGWLRVPRTLVYLGGASYAIYLVHFSVISLTVALLARLHLLPLNDATCLVVAGFGVIAGLGFDHLVDRPIQTALRRLKRRLGVPGNAKQPA